MTIAYFSILLTVLSLIASLVTEAIKKIIGDKFEYSKNIIVAIVSAVLGWGGCAVAFILLSIPFTTVTIICLVLMGPAVFLVATNGYDKVIQTIEQIAKLLNK